MLSRPQVVPAWTNLHWAAWRGDSATVSSLIQRGTDLQIRDVDGWTALHCAAASDPSGECTKLLLTAGARADSRSSSGATALHVATGRNNEAAMMALVAAGAATDVMDYHDKTPKDYAVSLLAKDILLGAWEGVGDDSNDENDEVTGPGSGANVSAKNDDKEEANGLQIEVGSGQHIVGQENVNSEQDVNTENNYCAQDVVDQQDDSGQQDVDSEQDINNQQYVSGQKDVSNQQDVTDQQDVIGQQGVIDQQDVSIQQDVRGQEDVTVQEDASVQQDASVQKDASVQQDASVQRDASVQQDVSVQRDASAQKDVSVQGDISVQQDISGQQDVSGRQDDSDQRDASGQKEDSNKEAKDQHGTHSQYTVKSARYRGKPRPPSPHPLINE